MKTFLEYLSEAEGYLKSSQAKSDLEKQLAKIEKMAKENGMDIHTKDGWGGHEYKSYGDYAHNYDKRSVMVYVNLVDQIVDMIFAFDQKEKKTFLYNLNKVNTITASKDFAPKVYSGEVTKQEVQKEYEYQLKVIDSFLRKNKPTGRK